MSSPLARRHQDPASYENLLAHSSSQGQASPRASNSSNESLPRHMTHSDHSSGPSSPRQYYSPAAAAPMRAPLHHKPRTPPGRSTNKYALPILPEQLDPRSTAVYDRVPPGVSAGAPFGRRDVDSSISSIGGRGTSSTSKEQQSAWYLGDAGEDPDDYLHDPNFKDTPSTCAPSRGLLNVGALTLLLAGILCLFAGYPLLAYFNRKVESNKGGFNLGGTNATGQIPSMAGFPSLIDPDTPKSVYNRVGADGVTKMKLVFSDEFNQDGRSFYPGDDPYWEAVDLHYWGTNNYEWYDPAAVTTADGALRITLSETPTHNLNFRGGMLQSWNKFCFTGGMIEASVTLPGYNNVPGLWPAFWMMGNLGRAGFGASLEGTWPYSYETCDYGTLPNQTTYDGIPAANAEGGDTVWNRQYGTKALSFHTGQKLSACTCPEDTDHPGPRMSDGSWKGRAAPEIDVFEAQTGGNPPRMEISQSLQVAPFNYRYELTNSSGPASIFHQPTSHPNSYNGAIFQQALSTITRIQPQTAVQFSGGDYATYGVDYTPGTKGNIKWVQNDQLSWEILSAALEPDPISQIDTRPISNEPMYIIFNLGISQSFGTPDFDNLRWPAQMSVDWVRVWQPEDNINIGCDPEDYPTKDYIDRHMPAYTDATYTLWGNERSEGGYGANWPRNRLEVDCNGPFYKTAGSPLRPRPKAPSYRSSEIAVGQSW